MDYKINSKVTELIRGSGVKVTIYDVNCPHCGVKTTMTVYPDETLEDALDKHLLKCNEFHSI